MGEFQVFCCLLWLYFQFCGLTLNSTQSEDFYFSQEHDSTLLDTQQSNCIVYP